MDTWKSVENTGVSMKRALFVLIQRNNICILYSSFFHDFLVESPLIFLVIVMHFDFFIYLTQCLILFLFRYCNLVELVS